MDSFLANDAMESITIWDGIGENAKTYSRLVRQKWYHIGTKTVHMHQGSIVGDGEVLQLINKLFQVLGTARPQYLIQ